MKKNIKQVLKLDKVTIAKLEDIHQLKGGNDTLSPNCLTTITEDKVTTIPLTIISKYFCESADCSSID